MDEEASKPEEHPVQIIEPDEKEPEAELINNSSSKPEPDDNLKNLTQLVYILQAISLVVGVTSIAGLILNYLKRDEVKGTYLESHFAWQMKTFWFALLGVILGWLLAIVLIGFLILGAVGLWYIYRIVKGWLAFNDGKELSNALF
ncbi:MAG: hypothetical protein KBT53_08015 [Porticoccus sp.]|nr:hypothetical protein [Porticoccus sp.]MBQ0808345.1 hypothetical protein [Porticoccus sp.]